jgi:hypothetical protein
MAKEVKCARSSNAITRCLSTFAMRDAGEEKYSRDGVLREVDS